MAKSINLSRDLLQKIKDIEERIISDVEDIAKDVELEGIGYMRQRVDTAVTRWGSLRQAGLVSGPSGSPTARPSAGRRETDQMYNAITGETNRSGNRIVTQWGWQDPELYYLIQEHGSDAFDTAIEGMESLHYSLHDAEEVLVARLKGLK